MSKKKKRLILFLIIVLLLIVIRFFINEETLEKANVYAPVGDGITVSFIDVGKADSIYINADGYNVLIDAGVKKDASEITSYLDRYNVNKLDMIIASHPDADHIGGMSTIVDKYQVDKYVTYDIDEKYDSYTKTYKTLLDTLDENNVDITYTTAGDTYTLGSMAFDILSPSYEYKDSNDDSVVVKLTYGESEFLFTGDASENVEQDLIDNNIDLSCDVLKVSHHGSRTATCSDFIEKSNPEVAVVCVGENIYKLPNIEVLERLKDYGTQVYRTDLSGDVVVKSDGKKIEVITEK